MIDAWNEESRGDKLPHPKKMSKFTINYLYKKIPVRTITRICRETGLADNTSLSAPRKHKKCPEEKW